MKIDIKGVFPGIFVLMLAFLVGCDPSGGDGKTDPTSPSTTSKTISFTSSGSPSGNSVYLEQVSTNNDEITLALKVKGGTDVCNAIIEINFDGSKINYVSAAEGSYLSQGTAGTTTFSAGLEQGSNGVLLIGVNKKGIVSGVTGDGILAQIVLKALNTQLNTAVNFNAANSALQSSSGANIPGTGFSGGNLSYQ